MPRKKSQYSFTKTKKDGKQRKAKLIEKVQKAVEQYKSIWVLSFTHFKQEYFNQIRLDWRDSELFLGKKKVMLVALGRNSNDEFRPNLSKLGDFLKGNSGLFFTNEKEEDILKYFSQLRVASYAIAGETATETVTLQKGPYPQFPHSMEPFLRNLGIPTTLSKQVVNVVADYIVCEKGKPLTSEAARILKLLQIQMSSLNVQCLCCWNNSKITTFNQNNNDKVDKEKTNSNMEEEDEKEKQKK
ncbi:mRNA turnover protein [Anaeramoeba ignava]|uniref:Ribosome assembly factor mrt4 n=1 Tax=Anaeramoeba ignava TaxID=1746090 RepID=A0A9Q0LGL3_ANAIG|nr:mRNA turnover protein [Anaeramoeba ignava]